MTDRDEIRQAVYDKYIKPTDRPSTHRVGLEFEFPVVNLSGEAMDFNTVHKVIDEFIEDFGFENSLTDDEGHIYSASDSKTGDNISCDCSYNTIELSFGVDKSLTDTYEHFTLYYNCLDLLLSKYGHKLTGMGINPGYKVNRKEPIPNGRYRMLLHHLKSYKRYEGLKSFHDIPDFGLMSCASQIQLDAEKDTLIDELNASALLEPFKAILFANSPFREFTCARDYFWRDSLHGLNPKNVDMMGLCLHSIDDLIDYICSESIYCVERGDKYINFRPIVLSDYFQREKITGEYYDNDSASYKMIDFSPEIEDISHLRSFKFNDPTYRGTIEFRSVCEQPVSEIMAAGAFQTGLMECLPELLNYLRHDCFLYLDSYCEPTDYRRIFVRKDFIKALTDASEDEQIRLTTDGLQSITKNKLRKSLIRLLEIAEKGLKTRGFKEENFLRPLYKRAETLTSPAWEMLQGFDSGKDISYYINKFSVILDE